MGTGSLAVRTRAGEDAQHSAQKNGSPPSSEPMKIIYRMKKEFSGDKSTFPIDFYDGRVWVKKGRLVLNFEPRIDQHQRLVFEGLERVTK